MAAVGCIPYMGSKRRIALELMEAMPRASAFYDLFAGGGAMTTAAIKSGKFGKFVMNDITDTPSLYLRAVRGELRNETRWISREDFFKLKDSDPYVRYCWSFGNNGRNYLYSKDIEDWKRAYHYASVKNDFSEMAEYDAEIAEKSRQACKGVEDIFDRKRAIRSVITKVCSERRSAKGNKVEKHYLDQFLAKGKRVIDLQHLESLESLRQLEQLQHLERLEARQGSYAEVQITEADALVYCDIPYRNTAKYNKADFDHEAFYNWVRNSPHLVVVSEYEMPSDFVCVKEVKHQTIFAQATHTPTIERFFVHESKLDRWPRLTLF